MSDEQQFNYEQLMHEAHRGVIRKVLREASRDGLFGEHHFYIVFDTTHPNVRLSERLLAQYPEEMTIILQYQFRNLRVYEDHFEVQLSFDNIPEILKIPFNAINGFVDPSVPFGMRLQTEQNGNLENSISMLVPGVPQRLQEHPGHSLDEMEEIDDDELEEELAAMAEELDQERAQRRPFHLAEVPRDDPDEDDETPVAEADNDSASQSDADEDESEEESGAEIVSLDAFRKKS